MGKTPEGGMPPPEVKKEIEDGIYFGKRADEYLVVETDAEGQPKRTVFRVPEYDLDYLKRAYRGRLEFKGRLPDGVEDQPASTVHGAIDYTSEDGKRRINESFGRIDRLMEKIKKGTNNPK